MKSSPETKHRAYVEQQTRRNEQTADLQRRMATRVVAAIAKGRHYEDEVDFWRTLLDESIASHGDLRPRDGGSLTGEAARRASETAKGATR